MHQHKVCYILMVAKQEMVVEYLEDTKEGAMEAERVAVMVKVIMVLVEEVLEAVELVKVM